MCWGAIRSDRDSSRNQPASLDEVRDRRVDTRKIPPSLAQQAMVVDVWLWLMMMAMLSRRAALRSEIISIYNIYAQARALASEIE